MGEWCEHCSQPGCKVYHVRPDPCRAFQCAWLEGLIPDELGPRKTGVIVFRDGQHRRRKIVLVEDRPGLIKEHFEKWIETWLKMGVDVHAVQAAAPAEPEKLVQIA